MHIYHPKTWHVDVDRYVNAIVPSNFIYKLPAPISHFLGYREQPQKDIGNVLVAFWACFGAFVGVVVIEAVFMIHEIRHHGPPLLIASFVNSICPPLHEERSNIS